MATTSRIGLTSRTHEGLAADLEFGTDRRFRLGSSWRDMPHLAGGNGFHPIYQIFFNLYNIERNL